MSRRSSRTREILTKPIGGIGTEVLTLMVGEDRIVLLWIAAHPSTPPSRLPPVEGARSDVVERDGTVGALRRLGDRSDAIVEEGLLGSSSGCSAVRFRRSAAARRSAERSDRRAIPRATMRRATLRREDQLQARGCSAHVGARCVGRGTSAAPRPARDRVREQGDEAPHHREASRRRWTHHL